MATDKHQSGSKHARRYANPWVCRAIDNVRSVDELVDNCNSPIGDSHSAYGNYSALYNGPNNRCMNIIALSTLHAWDVFLHVSEDLIVSGDKFSYTGW